MAVVEFGVGSRWVHVRLPLTWQGRLTAAELGVHDPAIGVLKYGIIRLLEPEAAEVATAAAVIHVAREKDVLPPLATLASRARHSQLLCDATACQFVWGLRVAAVAQQALGLTTSLVS